MAKTESTAVTRLIELAQQRPLEGSFEGLDWFGAPAAMGKPKKRLERERRTRKVEEVTQVVRVPGRPLQASPATVIGAFFAGVVTVALTMIVMRSTQTAPAASAPPSATVAPATVVTPAPPAVVTPATVVTPAPPTDPDRDGDGAGEPAALAVAEPTRASPPAPARTVDRPSRPARTRAPAEFARPRAGRAPIKEGGSPLAELRINSKPPCQLIVDGRDMGWTPQRGIAVAPGRHTVVFRNPEFGVERKVIVDAKVGEVHRVIRDFTEP